MKRFWSLILATALAVGGALAAHAEELPTSEQTVTFNSAGEMVSSYEGATVDADGSAITAGVTATLEEMQPGDEATFSIKLKNDYAESTDWYMINDVLNSLEKAASVASGGAYTYDLEYSGPGGRRTLYNNERVGGEDTPANTRSTGTLQGLEYATSSLGEEFFYLDTLARGQSGRLNLRVKLDGETQGNNYQDTLAQLIMQFGVELTPTSTVERRIHHQLVTSSQYHYRPVRTGDENRILLWSLVMLGCGLAALVLAFLNHRKDRRERE